MTKLSVILTFFSTFIALSASADRSYVCAAPGVSRTESLIVKGVDRQAQVHVEDSAKSGDFVFDLGVNSQAEDILDGTPEYQDLGFLGTITDKRSHDKFLGSFFISPAVLSGASGTIYIWTGREMTSLNCN